MKIMILGASDLQMPAILKAKKMQLHVIVADMDANAPGKKYADKFYNVSTTDTNSILEIAKKEKIDSIITVASDRPMTTVATVCEKLNLKGITLDTAYKATNKGIMREELKKLNIPIPQFSITNSKSSFIQKMKEFNNQVILKPVDNSGSRGVVTFNPIDVDEYDLVFNYVSSFSSTGEILIEELMEGPEVSVETLSINGECNVIAITDKITTGPPQFVETAHSEPSKLNYITKEKIIEVTKQAVNGLGIQDGPTHTEIIVTNDGPKIVEVGARLGGDNITSMLVPLSTGIDMIEATILISLGKSPNLTPYRNNKGAVIRYICSDSGVIKRIDGLEETLKQEGVVTIEISKKIGDFVNTLTDSNDRVGYIVCVDSKEKTAFEISEDVLNKLKIVTDNSGR